MMEKYITSNGKKHLLELGFLNDDNSSNFNFIALGTQNSSAAIDNTETSFVEANGYNYHREQLKQEDTLENTDTSISLSATFDSTNFNPSSTSANIQISEIGIVNQDVANDNDVFFAFMKVPPIAKTSNVSLKYTIIITME